MVVAFLDSGAGGFRPDEGRTRGEAPAADGWIEKRKKGHEMRKMFLPVGAVLMLAGGAFAQCDKSESACTKGGEAKVTTAALQEKAETCSKDGARTVATTEAWEKACAAACTKGVEGAAVQTVAYGPGEQGETSSIEKQCTKSVALASVPKMSMVVGDKTTTCSVEAKELCEKSGESVAYLVAGRKFECREKATKAYTTALTSHLEGMTRISYVVDGACVACPMEAKTRADAGEKVAYKVGNYTFECPEKAIAASVMAYNASQKVRMAMQVGETKTHCPVQARELANKTDAPIMYTVNGKTTKCEVTASSELAMARIEAAINAIEMVNAQG